MKTIKNTFGKETVNINYVDYGSGKPVILIHGWPLSHKSWERQIPALVEAGHRVIAYDRRGFGDSDAPWDGYDYDHLASDLHALITELKLKDVSLVGFSMGGGEVVRYLTNYGSDNVSKIALVASIIPLVKQKPDNPDGVPEEALKGIIAVLKSDRVGFLADFHKGFYNADKHKDAVSQQQLDYDFSIASQAAPQATIKAAEAWIDTDFRAETEKIQLPTLIIHGGADSTVPLATSAQQANERIEDSTLIIIEDAPHGLNITHAEQLNRDLIKFLKS